MDEGSGGHEGRGRTMKKTLKLILSVLLACFLLFGMFPERIMAEKEDSSGEGADSIPEDAFDGDFVEFEGDDGSKTQVFDNGSVITVYSDGSKEGFDYAGNHYVKGADGVNTIKLTDGTIATEYPDGRQSFTEPDGKTTTIYPDGRFSESFSSVGMTMDYDADAKLIGVGFTDDDQRIGTDEDGSYLNGEIRGKNGEMLKITDDGMHVVTADGKVADCKMDGNTTHLSINHPDGSTAKYETTVTWKKGPNGEMQKVEETTGNITHPDGSSYDVNKSVTYDENGNPIFSGNNAEQWTSSDGQIFWNDGNSRAFEYRDPNTGEVMCVDSNGNLTQLVSDQVKWEATYDENRNIVSLNTVFDDGATLTVNPDGTTTFVTPDGTSFVSDEGNVWKDGVQIKKDGKPLPEQVQDGEVDPYNGDSYDGDPWGDDWFGGGGNPFDDGPIYIGPNDHVSDIQQIPINIQPEGEE